ncbi:hypothetical protein IMZ48_03330 [Candidatus Bathyarchaeota archaeon]|nr:hypothetical protein [Candidatus Bathyarchaeota archaeon]
MFYWLLQKYRERQLENFNPEIVHSRSDYHHLKPTTGWRERRTTCKFTNSESRFGRSVSRFTVISRVAETEETVQSSDPYNSSNTPPQPQPQTGSAKVTIHRQKSTRPRRDSTGASREPRNHRSSTRSAPDSTRVRPKKSRVARLSSIQGTASSLNSTPSCRSPQGSPYVRNAKLRHNRRVDFSQVRAPNFQRRDQDSSPWDVRGGSVYVEQNPGVHRPDSGVLRVPGNRAVNRPIKKKPCAPRIVKHRGSEAISHEELRKFSNSLAKDCDEAFGASLIADPSVGASIMCMASPGSTPLTLGFPSSPILAQACYPSPPSDCEQWLNRPLPPLPLMAGAHTPPAAVPVVQNDGAPKRESGEKDEKRHRKIASHLHQLSMPIMTSKNDRRIASAPSGPANEKRLSSLFSSRGGKRGGVMVARSDGQDRGRIVSYPSGGVRLPDGEKNGADELPRPSGTTRVVDSTLGRRSSVFAGRRDARLEVGGQEQKRPQSSAFMGRQNTHIEAKSQKKKRPQSSAFTAQSTHLAAGIQEQPGPAHRNTGSISSRGSTSSGAGRSIRKTKPSWFLNKHQENAACGTSGYQVAVELPETHAQMQGLVEPSSAPNAHWSDSTDPASLAPPRKKKFGLLFWKSGKAETKMSIAGTSSHQEPLDPAKQRGCSEELSMLTVPDSRPRVRRLPHDHPQDGGHGEQAALAAQLGCGRGADGAAQHRGAPQLARAALPRQARDGPPLLRHLAQAGAARGYAHPAAVAKVRGPGHTG